MFVVMVNGELAENATMKLFSLFGTATKKNMPSREEIDDASTWIIIQYFGMKTDFNEESVNLGMISAIMHSTLPDKVSEQWPVSFNHTDTTRWTHKVLSMTRTMITPLDDRNVPVVVFVWLLRLYLEVLVPVVPVRRPDWTLQVLKFNEQIRISYITTHHRW